MKKFQFWIVFIALLLSLVITGTVLAADPDQNPPPTTSSDKQVDTNTEASSPAPDILGTDAVSTWYTFVSSSGTYTEITGGTVLCTGSGTNCDDDSFNAINLGFTFNFDGVAYTQVSVQNNGFIAMGSSVSSSYYPLSTGSTNNVISALGFDLKANVGGVLRYELLGSAPNRVFVIQWKDYGAYYGTMPGDEHFNFQIRLNETTDFVDIVYGPFVKNATARAAQVGLRGASSADFNNRMTDATHFWSNSLPGSANTSTMTLDPATLPGDGLTYEWSPPPVVLNTSYKAAPAFSVIGDPLTYTIHIINTGDELASGVLMTDTLPLGTVYNNDVTCEVGTCTYDAVNNRILFTGDVVAGTDVQVTFSVNSPTAVCANTVSNTAQIYHPISGLIQKTIASMYVYYPPFILEGFENITFPPTGWTEVIVNDTGTDPDWSRVTTGGSPAINPHSGVAMVKFNSYNVATGGSARLYTPSLNFTTAQVPLIEFWMSHDTGYNNKIDRLQVQASTDGGTTWTNVGAEVLRYDANCTVACWKLHSIDLTAYAGQPSVMVGLLAISDYGNNIYVDDLKISEPWSPCPTFSLEPDYTTQACRGSTLDLPLTASNYTPAAETYDLEVTAVWPTLLDPISLTLGAGETGVSTASVHIPWAAEVGESDTASVVATGQSNGRSDTAAIQTTSSFASGWTDLASNAHAMRQSGVVYYNGKIYVIGGYTGTAQNYVDIYDITSNSWSSGSPLPTATSWWDCVEISGKIYCAGGYTTTGSTVLRIYDIAGNSWTTGAAMSATRYSFAGVAVNGKYYVIGGYTGSYMNTIWAYDPVSDTWDYTLPNMSSSRRYEMAGVIGSKIYVVGGYNGSYLSSMEVFDTNTNTWSAGTSMPVPLMNAADGVINDRYLILSGGGPTASGQTNQTWLYDVVDDSWSSLPNLPRALYAAEADSDGTNYWMMGGYSGSSYIGNTTRLDRCFACIPVSGASFTVDPTSPRPGIEATFTASIVEGSSPVTYDWDFGDGTTGTGEVITHIYDLVGTYTVVMTATNCDGVNTSVITQDVIVIAGPLVEVDPLALDALQCPDCQTEQVVNVCNGGDADLVWQATEPVDLLWLGENPAAGTVLPDDCEVITATFDSTGLAPGIYTGTLEIVSNDTQNPVVPVDISLTVAGGPTNASFTYEPASPIIGEQVSFNGTADALQPIEFTWDFGDGITGTGQTSAHAYDTYGTYTVVMTATACGGADVFTSTVTVQPCFSFLDENFESTFPPANWNVINNGGTCVWMRNDQVPSGRPNYAGGLGFAADADSDRCGSGSTMDTELHTMSLDLTEVHTATLQYMTSYNDIATGGDYADVDVSIDGGATWTNIQHWDADHSAYGPGELVRLDLTSFVGHPNVLVRYHYYLATYDWWWEVDQVNVTGCIVPNSQPEIVVTPEELNQTLQIGQTADQTFNIANDGFPPLDWTVDVGCGAPVDWLSAAPLAGTVPSHQDTDVTATFDSTGLVIDTYQAPICVNSNDPVSPTVEIIATLIVTGTPDIDVTMPALDVTLGQDSTTTLTGTVCNAGDGPLNWELTELQSAFLGNSQDAMPAAQPAPQPEIIRLPDGTVDCAAYQDYAGYEPEEVAAACPVKLPESLASTPLAPTDIGYAQDIGYISDNFVRFTLNNFSGQTVVGMNTNVYYGMDFDPEAQVLYALNDSTDQLGTINLETGAFTGLVSCPPGGGAANWTGLSIDPASGVFYASTATSLFTIDPATGVSTLIGPFGTSLMIDIAVNMDGQMYGHDIGTDSIYSINISTGAATLIGLTGYSANYAQGMDFDNDDGTLYIFLYIGSGANVYGTVNLTTGAVTPLAVNAPLGEFEGATQTAGVVDIPWLSETPTSGTLLEGECTDVGVTFDSTGLLPDIYTAGLKIASNDPDEPEITFPVTLTVAPPIISISPLEFDVALLADESATLPMTITNLGQSTLDWQLYDGVPYPGWSDNFDSYPTGSSMHGQGGWKGWGNDPAATAYTSDDQARSIPNSVDINGASDLVHEYSGINSGVWTYTAWQYIPATFTGVSDFILMNTYNDPGVGLSWSVQVEFDSVANLVRNTGDSAGELTLIRDQWIELRVEIDLDDNTQSFYYDDQLLYQGTWTDEVSVGGALNLAAVDLFANTGSSVYYDDLSLAPVASPACGVWGDVPWLSTDPISGSTTPAGSTPVDVMFDPAGIPVGVYTATLCAASNDLVTPLVPVPVTMNVYEMGIDFRKTVGTQPGVCAATDSVAVPPGSEVTYCFSADNTGTMTYTMVSLSDSELGDQLFDHYPVIVPPGDNVYHLESVTILTDTTNTAEFTFFVDESHFITATDSATVSVTKADLAVTKTGPTEVIAGNPITYTVSVENLGPDAATNVLVTDTLPAGATFVSAPGCAYDAGKVTCSLASLPDGETSNFVIVITMAEPGDILNTVAVSANQLDLKPENNTADWKTAIAPSTFHFYLPIIFKN